MPRILLSLEMTMIMHGLYKAVASLKYFNSIPKQLNGESLLSQIKIRTNKVETLPATLLQNTCNPFIHKYPLQSYRVATF